ncbi:bacteriocin-associated protein [Lactobacillus mulieris]|uniref:bacteriocin-associated protein n=1 Tax=Lactobacillus mulieris TaxID=2508708 RepID=UPI002242E908|nr:bacteriocin-associated protein [Lactobacillus mulieris]MCW8106380.1 bacteriocin-associated protein [Lactobacillus mulieris]MDK7349207.1 bacteriocin-associated protein [Lactobacillus mulieris]
MFKTIKLSLFTIISIVAFFLLSTVIRQYDLETIPGEQNVIKVYGDKQKANKAQVFFELKKVARKGHYQLTLIRQNTINNSVTKSIYVFNSDLPYNASLYRNSAVKQFSSKEVELLDLKGEYYTNASSSEFVKLQSKLTDYGLKFEVGKDDFWKVAFFNENILNYLLIFISVFAIFFTVSVMEKVANLKKYAILRLNGWNFFKILVRDLLDISRPFAIILSALIIIFGVVTSWEMNLTGIIFFAKYGLILELVLLIFALLLELLSYFPLLLAKLGAAIKGQTYSAALTAVSYLLKIVLLIVVFFNLFILYSSVKNLHDDQNIMNMWISRGSGYTIQYGYVDPQDRAEEDKLGNLTKKLVAKNSDVIISRTNQEYHPASNNFDVTNGNVLIINKNFLKYNKLEDLTGKDLYKLRYQAKTLYVFVPITHKSKLSEIKKNVVDYTSFQQELSGRKGQKLNFEYILIKNPGQVFNYLIVKEISDSISTNPVFIVDSGLLSNDFYFSSATKGMIQFKNLQKLKTQLSQLGLQSYIVGITDAKTRLSNFNITISRKLTILSLTIVLSIGQLFFLMIFIASSFLQKERPRMAIRKVFGISNYDLVLKFTSFNLLIDIGVAILVAIFCGINWILIFGLIAYLILETSAIIVLAMRAERGLLTTINHGN